MLSQAAAGFLASRTIRRRLLAWYGEHKRDLPWRRTRDPYCIWISEIMLQQTRVAAVIPYYARFLEAFPDAGTLAAAPEQQLLAAWAGLGYYSRARNLQEAARRIVERRDFPRDYASLRALPGIGDYTAAAIASIAFGLPHPVLDGNVLRVLSRLTAERGNVQSQTVRRRLHAVAADLLDSRRPGEFNQALMELGATLCLAKQPQCPLCPLRAYCQARRLGCENQLPVRAARPRPGHVQAELLVIEKGGKLLVWKRPPDSPRLAGFWELPERSQVPGAVIQNKVAAFRHTIVNTSYSFQVHRASLARIPQGFRWLAREHIGTLPFSTTARKALACLESDKQKRGLRAARSATNSA